MKPAGPAAQSAGRGFFFQQGTVVLAGLLAVGAGKAFAIWAVAKWLGPVTQGVFSLALAGMNFGAILLCGGLEYANAFVAGQRSDRLGAIVGNTLGLGGAALLLAPLWVWGFAFVFPQVMGNINRGPWPDGVRRSVN